MLKTLRDANVSVPYKIFERKARSYPISTIDDHVYIPDESRDFDNTTKYAAGSIERSKFNFDRK